MASKKEERIALNWLALYFVASFILVAIIIIHESSSDSGYASAMFSESTATIITVAIAICAIVIMIIRKLIALRFKVTGVNND